MTGVFNFIENTYFNAKEIIKNIMTITNNTKRYSQEKFAFILNLQIALVEHDKHHKFGWALSTGVNDENYK